MSESPADANDGEYARKVHDWWLILTDAFRENARNVNEDQLRLVKSHWNYGYPFSVDHVWIRRPESHIAIISRFDKSRDKIVSVHGPLSWGQLVPFLDRMSREQRWARKLSRDLGPPRPEWASDKLAGNLIHVLAMALNSIRGWAAADIEKPQFVLNCPVAKTCTIKVCIGDILAINPEEEGSWPVEDAVFRNSLASGKEKATPSVQGPSPIQAFSTVFYPAITVGSPPTYQDLKSLFSKQYLSAWNDVVLLTSFRDMKLAIRRNGYVTIATDERTIARQVCNLIFACAALEGSNTFSVREAELKAEEVNAETLEFVSSHGSPPALRNTILYDSSYTEYGRVKSRQTVGLATMSKIIARAENISGRDHLAAPIIRWLQAKTFFEETEYEQSFIMSWINIERDVLRTWSEKVPKDIRKLLIEKRKGRGIEPAVSKMLIQLQDGRCLPPDRLDMLFSLNQDRNGFMHSGRKVPMSSAVAALDMSRLIITELIEAEHC
ncbi:MAG: hypothetical protein JRN15_02490 [Nitrososphaerota archaeon]|nr:hypothetical protein [Nitrososphaerota archaeon]